ncbi:MAG: chemotaxis protein CheX [Verrucomicrobiae bacterium]
MPDLLKIIDKNVPAVFLTMAGLTATPGNGDAHPQRPSTLHGVTGSVSLSGKASGIVYTGFSHNLACIVTMRVLGRESPGEEEVSDVVGEFTNMITGNLKSHLCDSGYDCQLSIPTVMRGDEIEVVAKSAPICVRNTYRFEELQEELVVLVFAKLDT